MTKRTSMIVFASLIFTATLGVLPTQARETKRSVAETKAVGQCIRAIRQRPAIIIGSRPQPMPRICDDFGQGSLNGPITDLFGHLGTPDALSYSSGYLQSENSRSDKGVLEVSYLIPRRLNELLKAHGRSQVSYFVQIVLAQNSVIRAANLPSFAGLNIGDSKERLYRTLGKPSHTDKSGEVLFYDPYPLLVGLDESKRKVVSFRVSTTIDYMDRLEGPGDWNIRNTSGKIVGVKLYYLGTHRP